MPLAREVVSREAVAAGAVGRWNMSVDYQRRWSVRGSVAGFGQDICDAWASEYSAGAELDTENLVVVDPGNGFSYLFDLAGTLRGEPCSRARDSSKSWSLFSLVRGPGARLPGGDSGRCGGFPRHTWLLLVSGTG